MSKKFLVILKSPVTSFMIEDIIGKFPKIKSMDFMEGGKSLWIPVNTDSNIAYIQEMTDDDIEEFELRVEEMKDKIADMRAKVLKPKFQFPKGKSS